MSANRKKFLRHPRTTQELRANQDKHNLLIRAKRRNLPTAYNDLFPQKQKSWKKRRSQQYHTNNNYCWHEFRYNRKIAMQADMAFCLMKWLDFHDYSYQWKSGFIRYFGPDWK